MQKYFNILRKCPLFFGIEDDNLARMLTCLGAKIEVFDKKTTIFAEGSVAKYIGIVLKGTAQMTQIDYYGNRSILSGYSPTDIFAEAFACAEVSEIPISVVADEPCTVMLIDCSHVLHTCQNHCGFHQQLIFNLMREMAMKNLTFHQKLEVTSKRTTREKLMAYLLQISRKSGSMKFDIPFDRQELADYLEVERSGLSTEIGKMKKEGIIANNKNHFELLVAAQ